MKEVKLDLHLEDVAFEEQMEQELPSWLREPAWSIGFSPIYHHKYSTWHIVAV